MNINIKKSLLYTAFLVLLVVFSIQTNAQALNEETQIQQISPTIAEQTVNQVENSLQKRVNNLEEMTSQVSNKVNLNSKTETLINLLTLFSSVLLGVFVIIGGLIVWNGYALRKEAKEDLAEIKRFRIDAAKLFTEFRKNADETVKFADKTVKDLAQRLEIAKQHSKAIEDKDKTITNILSNWDQKKTTYSNASQGTATYFEPILPLSQPNPFVEAMKKRE